MSVYRDVIILLSLPVIFFATIISTLDYAQESKSFVKFRAIGNRW